MPSPYVPPIRNYKPFYVQAAGDSTAWDTCAYGMVAQTQPFLNKCEVKEPYKNDWKDEHGDDEYIPSTLCRKAFEFTVKFYVKTYAVTGNSPQTAISVLNGQIADFRAKLLGGEMKVWDSWQETGFQKVRYVKDDADSADREIDGGSARVIFSVTFKVNDPATAMAYNAANNTIAPASQS